MPPPPPTSRRRVGVDVFLESMADPAALGPALEALTEGTPLRLKMISNRGTVVYPATGGTTACVDHHRCRFKLRELDGDLDNTGLLALLTAIGQRYVFMHVEVLQEIDGQRGYSLAQGEADAQLPSRG